MKEIIKYQLMDRWQKFRIAGGVMAALNLIAFVLLLASGISGSNTGSAGGFWLVLGTLAAIFVPLAHFFTAGSGHMHEILYRNINYLVLSVPRSGAQILGGRMIAGLIEFVAYAILGIILLTLNYSLVAVASLRAAQDMSLIEALGLLLKNLDPRLLTDLGVTTVLGLAYFFLIGSVFSFATIASSTLVKNRRVAGILTFIGAIFLFVQIGRLGDWLNNEVPAFRPLVVHLWDLEKTGLNTDITVRGVMAAGVPIHLVTLTLLLVVAAGLFFLTSRLIDRKVEV